MDAETFGGFISVLQARVLVQLLSENGTIHLTFYFIK